MRVRVLKFAYGACQLHIGIPVVPDGGMMRQQIGGPDACNCCGQEGGQHSFHNILRDFYFGAGVPPGPVISEFGSLYPVSPLRMNCVLPSVVLTTLLFSSHDHMLMRRFGVFTRTCRLTTCHGSTSDRGS